MAWPVKLDAIRVCLDMLSHLKIKDLRQWLARQTSEP